MKYDKRIQKYNETLDKYFGFNELKEEQKIIIDKIIHYQRDVCAVLCTGFGKSVCFQLPPLITNKISIVISPLISLMTDQQLLMNNIGIKSCCINSTCIDKLKLLNRIMNEEFNIVFITPESIENNEHFFREMSKKKNYV